MFLTVDGCHGTGTSTHADALAAGLRAEGYDAAAYHHPRHPAGAEGSARVRHYIGARDDLMRSPPAAVVVMDRGALSGLAHARASGDAEAVAVAEMDVDPWWYGVPVVVLDASDEALDARLRARGEDPLGAEAERCEWAHLCRERGLRVVRTDRDADVVRAELLAWALREVGRDVASGSRVLDQTKKEP